MIGKGQMTISRYESGTSVPSLQDFCMICDVFEKTPIDLMDANLKQHFTSKNAYKVKKYLYENKEFFIYYMSTSKQDELIECYAFTCENIENHYIEFAFEVEHNKRDNQIYDGKLVIETDNSFFYFNNKNRHERGMIITYNYPRKNKENNIILLGEIVSIAHGKESAPCYQRCVLTTNRIRDYESLKEYLKLKSSKEHINSEYVAYIDQLEDSKLYSCLK